jgi:hypothetical protein
MFMKFYMQFTRHEKLSRFSSHPILHVTLSAFTNDVECTHFLDPGRSCYNVGDLILLFCGVLLYSYWESLVVPGSVMHS